MPEPVTGMYGAGKRSIKQRKRFEIDENEAPAGFPAGALVFVGHERREPGVSCRISPVVPCFQRQSGISLTKRDFFPTLCPGGSVHENICPYYHVL